MTIRTWVGAGVTIGLLGTAFATLPGAAAATPAYADWTLQSGTPDTGTMTVPLGGFPAATYTTNASTTTLPTGASTWLNTATPFGARFGSSENKAYLNQNLSFAATNPAVITYTFDTATAASGWGFALGDIDADQVTLAATDENGAALSADDLGFQSVFNYCGSSPKPSSCPAGFQTDVPTWNPATMTLVGNVADTQGAAGWFAPTKRVKTLTMTFQKQTGSPTYQTWFAADDVPPIPSPSPSVSPSPTATTSPTASPTTSPTPSPTPTPTPSPTTKPETPVDVVHRDPDNPVPVGQWTPVVSEIDTPKAAKVKVTVTCRVGRVVVKRACQWKFIDHDRIKVKALCTDRLTITVRITAKEPGHRRTVWKQKYTVKKKPFIVCTSRGTG